MNHMSLAAQYSLEHEKLALKIKELKMAQKELPVKQHPELKSRILLLTKMRLDLKQVAKYLTKYDRRNEYDKH